MKLDKGDCIGFIGKTGEGKSTLVDIMMGLLPPTSGSLIVDDVDIHGFCDGSFSSGWRKLIAHVPQSIYLLDDTIANNIAFGIPNQQIDMERVYFAAKLAELSSVIDSFPLNYLTKIGERGVRLSGGQRQRIAIARALYRQSSMLILDEATSALDSNTEKSIINNIHLYLPKMTIVMIAHRLSTLKNCQKVFRVSNQSVLESSIEDN